MPCAYCDADVDGGCKSAVASSDCLLEQLRAAEEEIDLLRERLEDKTTSLRFEIAAKQDAHNEIRILEGALRSAVRRLNEGHEIKPESQAHGDMRDALA